MNEHEAMVEWYWQGNPRYWDRNLFQCYFVSYELTRNRSRSSAVTGRRLTKQWHCLDRRHLSSTEGWFTTWMVKHLSGPKHLLYFSL